MRIWPFGKEKREITVQETAVTIVDVGNEDFICLTDMIKSQDGDFVIADWLRNRNTLEFLAVWERMYNPNFNMENFFRVAEKSGLHGFKISVKEWIEQTNARGIVVHAGRYGGTYAHRDIAFEFGTWISPVFKLYLIKEYQRLKEIETNQYHLEWNVRRIVSKANYQIHTDAIKNHLIPISRKWNREMEYAEEADILNLAVFGCTAKEWRDKNPGRAKNNENIRDSASINELVVLSNMETQNAKMIRDGLSKQIRFEGLQRDAQHQLQIFEKTEALEKALKKTSPDVYLLDKGTPKKE